MSGKVRRRRLTLVVVVLLALALTIGWFRSAAAARSPACTAETPAVDRPLLKAGVEGTCVTVLQEALVASGHPVAVDGSFSAETELAVRRYQARWLGLTIDGIVGPDTWTALVGGAATPYAIRQGPNPTPRVVLSYDDCPTSVDAFRRTVRDAQALGIALAIFPYGDCIAAGRVDVAEARARGHYVFNHSVSHADLTSLAPEGVLTELGAPGVQSTFGRPPYGSYDTPTVLDAYTAKGMRVWTWTVDTQDWRSRTQEQVVSTVLTKATAGSTVLMHLQHAAFNGDALRSMRDGLAARGLVVCQNRGPTEESPQVLDC